MVIPKVETYFRVSLMDCTTKVCRCLYSAPALTGLTAVQRTRHGRAPLVYCTTKVHQCSQLALNLTELLADPTRAGATRILYY